MAEILRRGLRPLRQLPNRLEQASWLDRVGGVVAAGVERVAPDASPLNSVLSGTDTGHPLHPPLTDVVIGAWTSALALDWLGGPAGDLAADRLVGLGVLSALPTAAAGLNDWATFTGPDRRLGLVHGATNVLATGLFAASWRARKSGRRLVGRYAALVGYAAVSVGGFLGGHLSFRRGAGVDHTAFVAAPANWTPVADEVRVPESTPLLVEHDGVEIVIVRRQGSWSALLARCAHQGGPLAEGSVADGCLVCPWHGSRFRLSDGVAMSGPTAHPQPTLEVRVREGTVEVRRAPGPWTDNHEPAVRNRARRAEIPSERC